MIPGSVAAVIIRDAITIHAAATAKINKGMLRKRNVWK
jgi:hypothetical protein